MQYPASIATELLSCLGAQPANRVVLVDLDGSEYTAEHLLDRMRASRERFRAKNLISVPRVAALVSDKLINAFDILVLCDICSVMPLNPALEDRALAEAMAKAEVTSIWTEQAWLDRFAGRLVNVPSFTFPSPDPGPCGTGEQHHSSLVLSTSGSTGAPKRVPLAPQHLLKSARRIAGTLQLGADDWAISALPVFHIGAIVDLMLAPLLAGGGIVAAKDKTPAALYDAACGRGTWLQLVPTMLTRCLSELSDSALTEMGAELRFIRMVSADLSPALQSKAERAFSGTPLIQMYGMTETAGQIASNPLPPAKRKPGSVGLFDAGDVAIFSEEGLPAPGGTQGEICVGERISMRGYDGDEETPRYGSWLRTGDLGEIDPDGYLFLRGRLKDLINRGGEKISPITIERAALELEGVDEAVAYARPHPTLGEQVGLAVVAPALNEMAILTHLRGCLAEFQLPRHIEFFEAFPRLGSGKIDRRAVAQGGATGQDRAAPRDQSDLERSVSSIWMKILNAPAPFADEDFFDAGGDSLSATEFLIELERTLRIKLPANLLFEAPRFAQIVSALEREKEKKRPDNPPLPDSAALKFSRRAAVKWPGERVGANGLWIERNKEMGGQPIFFCCNGVQLAKTFSATIGAERRHFVVRSLVHHEDRSVRTQNTFAKALAEDLSAVWPDGRLVIGGMCEGAETMVAAARVLAERGRKVDLMLAFDFEFVQSPSFPVVNIWTDSRWYSPYGRFLNPARGLVHRFPNGAIAYHLKGAHGDALTPAAMNTIKPEVVAFIDGEPLPSVSDPEGLSLLERQARWKSKISVRMPRLLKQDQTVVVKMSVRNTSGRVWPESNVSGLYAQVAVVGWRKLKKKPFYPWFKRVWGKKVPLGVLNQPLEPGQTKEFEFKLVVPRRKGLYLLRVSMLDDGIAHFVTHWRRGRYIPIWISAPTE